MASRACAIYTFDDEGLLELERTYYDKATVLEQLGIYQDPRSRIGRIVAVLTPPFTILQVLKRRLLRR
jgi:hypothetical protein